MKILHIVGIIIVKKVVRINTDYQFRVSYVK